MAEDLAKLFCLSLSAKDGHAVNERESARLPDNVREIFLRQQLAQAPDEHAGLVYLQTCHRVEFYGFGYEPKKLQQEWMGLCRTGAAKARLLQGEAALRHLIRVTSSLESEVLGETQITGQVKEAVETARELGLLRVPLLRCVQQAQRCAKRIRTETGLGEGAVSVAHVAIDGLFDVFETLEDKAVLLVGGGSMARQSLERLLKWKVERITWAARSPDKLSLEGLDPSEQGRVTCVNLERLHALVWTHAVTVAATASPELLVNKALLEVERPSRVWPGAKVILDLGLPRNVDERVHGYGDFYVRNVDEFNNRVEQQSEARRHRLAHAEALLTEEIAAFLRTWDAWQRAPLMRELFALIESIKALEILEIKSDSEYMSGNALAKLMHRLIAELEQVEEPLSTQMLETLVRAWRHPEEWLLKRKSLPPSLAKELRGESPPLPPEQKLKLN